MLMDGGRRGIANYVSVAEDIVKSVTERRDYSPAALMLRGDMGSAENRASCITNPVWTIPAKFYYPSPPSTCSIEPGDLRVSISFGVSMDSTLSDRCSGGDCLAPLNGGQSNYQGPRMKIYPLNSSGESVGNGTALKLRWFANNLSGPGFKKKSRTPIWLVIMMWILPAPVVTGIQQHIVKKETKKILCSDCVRYSGYAWQRVKCNCQHIYRNKNPPAARADSAHSRDRNGLRSGKSGHNACAEL